MHRSSIPAAVTALALTGGLLAGCTSPREKDCKKIMPLVEESKSARVVGVIDGGLLQPTFAERPRRTADALRALVLDDPQMKPPVMALADANERFATAMAAFDQLVSTMKLEKGAARPFAPNILDSVRPHVEQLVKRCGLGVRTEQQRALPDCIALERALQECVTPAADDTPAEEQLLTCASTVGKIRSEDEASNQSLQQLATTLRDLEPMARNIGAPAKEVIRAARQHAGEISKQSVARAEVERNESALRELCLRAGGHP